MMVYRRQPTDTWVTRELRDRDAKKIIEEERLSGTFHIFNTEHAETFKVEWKPEYSDGRN
jgi:hypothetical protein